MGVFDFIKKRLPSFLAGRRPALPKELNHLQQENIGAAARAAAGTAGCVSEQEAPLYFLAAHPPGKSIRMEGAATSGWLQQQDDKQGVVCPYLASTPEFAASW